MTGKKIAVKCPGTCPCPAPLQTSSTDKTGIDSDLRQSSYTLKTTDLCFLICFCCSPVCSELDLKEVVSRLKDWFRVLHQNTDHERVKKPEKSSESVPEAAAVAARKNPPNSPEMLKTLMNRLPPPPAELEVGVSPLCREPLGWMFSRLDTNFDLQLDQSEIKSLYLDRKEPCSNIFFQSCDVHADKVLTSSEWCSCFQRYTGRNCPPSQSSLSDEQERRVAALVLEQNSSSLIECKRRNFSSATAELTFGG